MLIGRDPQETGGTRFHWVLLQEYSKSAIENMVHCKRWYSTRDQCRRGSWGWRVGKILGLCWLSLFDIGGIGGHLGGVTGYHIKQTCLLCRTSYSQATRPALVGPLEPVGANLGLHTHYEAGFWMGLEFGHHPVDLSSPLQRRSRVSEVYDNVKKRT